MTDLPQKAERILDALTVRFPDAHCELDFGTPFELLVSVILSAQCTDKRVNAVTTELYKVANTPEAFAVMPQEELEGYIRSCGFFRSKAAAIISASRDIIEKFGGRVPDSLEDLTSLRGVGTKTAKVVLNNVYNRPVVAVDTHIFRTARRLGLSRGSTPDAVSTDLESIVSDKYKHICHHLLIFFGRYCCKSQRPLCNECPVVAECAVYK